MSYWNIDRIMSLCIGIAIAAGVVWLLNRLSNVLLPFFAACLVAYLMNPIVVFLQKKCHVRSHVLAVVLTLLSVGIVLAGLVWLCIPMIAKEIESLETMIRYYLAHPAEFPVLPQWAAQWLHDFQATDITRYLDTTHLESIITKGGDILSLSIESAIRILEWLLMFIYIIFILLDYRQIASGFKKIFPAKVRPAAMSVTADVEKAMNGYFRGQGLVALCACVLYCIGFSIIGLPLAIVMGIIVGILYMIPYFQYVTLIPVALICFISAMSGETPFWSMMGKSLLVYLVSQSICDYVITPHIMRKEMGLNPAMILLSLSVWGSLLGIMGMVIALPATSLILAYYERYISNRGLETAPDAQLSNKENPKHIARKNQR